MNLVTCLRHNPAHDGVHEHRYSCKYPTYVMPAPAQENVDMLMPPPSEGADRPGEIPVSLWTAARMADDAYMAKAAEVADLQRRLRRAEYERDDARNNEVRANDRLQTMRSALMDAMSAIGQEGEQLARLREVCESYGLPTDIDALVTHVENNSGYVGYLRGILDQAEALQHVGCVDRYGTVRNFPCPNKFCAEQHSPVFRHDDWLDRVPNTERNQA